MNALRIVACGLVVLVVGCGKKHSPADVERGQRALVAALDSWKNNEPSERLKSLADPVECTDELRASYRLVDFALGTPNRTDPEVIRYPVTLKLQDRKGKAVDRDVVFMVALKSPIVIARDPYE